MNEPVLQLVKMTEGKDGSDENTTSFLGCHKEKVREIGLELHNLGGIEAMRLAYHTVYLEHPTWATELDYAFNGVGDWVR